jgi:hypothetical protein
MTRRKTMVATCGVLALVASLAAHAQSIALAFVGDEGSFGAHNKGALKWAKAQFDTTVVSTARVEREDLTRFAVVWWQDGDADPAGLLTPGGKKALQDYVRNGGTVLLSAAAEQLATPLGVESGVFRVYGPGADAQAAGLTIREDTVKHPVWEGFKRTAGERIQVTSVGYPKSSDYWSRKYIEAVTIGDCWETGSNWTDEVGAFVEWRSGKGLVFGMGWRLPHWTDDNKDRATLEKLTTNVVRYLAGESAFLAVSAVGRHATFWARLKEGR